MSIYFGNKGLEKRLDEMLAENTFFLDAWAYAKPIDAEVQYLLDCIAPVVFLKEVQTNVNKRKIALKIYKREKSLIEMNLLLNVTCGFETRKNLSIHTKSRKTLLN